MASVVIMRPATDAASCNATRTTFAGSTMPALDTGGALSRQMSIGHFRHRISPSVSPIPEQKQWGSIPRRRASWQYRIYSDNAIRRDGVNSGAVRGRQREEMLRTSDTHPIQIAAVDAGADRGKIGITLAPGKNDRFAIGGPWARDLDKDLDAIVAWGAKTIVTLLEFAGVGSARHHKAWRGSSASWDGVAAPARPGCEHARPGVRGRMAGREQSPSVSSRCRRKYPHPLSRRRRTLGHDSGSTACRIRRRRRGGDRARSRRPARGDRDMGTSAMGEVGAAAAGPMMDFDLTPR